MESDALVDKVVVTLTLVKAKTLANSGRVHVKTLRNTMADKISEIMAKRFACTLRHVDFDELLNTLAHTLAELQVKKPADKLCDVKVLALVDILAYTLAKKKERTLPRNPGEMWRLGHCSRSWLTGQEKKEKAKKVSTH